MNRRLFQWIVSFCVAICAFASVNVFAQSKDTAMRVSVLTCAPGAELYSSFGHCAFRIQEPAKGYDYVYNYGTFNFDDPDFYTKFVRGKLLYQLSKESMSDFMYEYQVEQRSVVEQTLNLTEEEKLKVLYLLETNLAGQNRFYKYDFLIDNCATRPRDILFKHFNIVLKKNIIKPGVNARRLIYNYLNRAGQPWSKLGIDILLGADLDKPLTNSAAMFLPDLLMAAVDTATIDGRPLVSNKHMLLDIKTPIVPAGKFIPLAYFSIICLVLFGIFYYSKNEKLLNILDRFLLFITGLMGVFLLFMWFGTDHSVCKHNYNLLWALPTNIVAFIFFKKNPKWLKAYFFIAFIVSIVLLSGWFWLPQKFNFALAPLVLLMISRYGLMASGQREYYIYKQQEC